MSLTSCWLGKTSDKSVAKEINRRIDQQIKDDKKVARTQVKLLVLGTSESGKSTFLKQMRIIHGSGYSDKERLTFVPLISRNIHVAMKTLIKSMEFLNIEFESEENEKLAERYTESDDDEESRPITRQIGDDLTKLWSDSGIQRCYSRRDEFQLSDSASYFMSNLDRIAEKGYIPSLQDVCQMIGINVTVEGLPHECKCSITDFMFMYDENCTDILRSRMPTSGIREYQFDIGSFAFGIVDVGGQKSERRKWIHCFENVTSIIFLAALSEYNMTIPLEEVSQDIRASLRYKRRNAVRKQVSKSSSSVGLSGISNGFGDMDTPNGSNPHNPSHKRAKHRPSNRRPAFVATGFPEVSTPSKTDSPDQNGNMRKQSNDSSQSDTAYLSSHINRMEESKALFKTIISSEYFQSTSVILFLNKKDILAEKVMSYHISDHFPEFQGPKCNAEAARNFILTKYADSFERRRTPKRDLYAHFTCATDTKNIKYVFAAVKDIILKNYLITYNLV